MLEDDIAQYHSAQALRLLRRTILPDPDFYGIASIAALLERVSPLFAQLAPEMERRSKKLQALCQRITSRDPALPPELRTRLDDGRKLLHSRHPLYAALYDLSQRQHIHPSRLILTAHVIAAINLGRENASESAIAGGCRSLRLL